MSKTRDTGYLANVIQVHDTGVRIMSGSEMLMEISSSGAVTITGELSGSDAANALLLSGTGSVGFTTTGSFTTMSSSLSSRTTQIESVYATTGSNSFRATQSITGSLTVTGQIIAQTLNVQQVTSSVVYSSGSNVFGCDINSRQTFTGSFYQTGSVSVFNSCVGINCISPGYSLDVNGTTHFRSDGGTMLIESTQPTNSSTLRIVQCSTGGNGNADQGLVVQTNAGDGTSNIAHFYDYNNGSAVSRVRFLRSGVTCFQNTICVAGQVSSEDVRIYRSAGATTGYINFGSTGTNYFGFDGTRFSINGSINAGGATFSDTGDTCLVLRTTNSGNPRFKFCGGAGVFNRSVAADIMYFGESSDTGLYMFRGGTLMSDKGACTGTYGFTHCGASRWGRFGMPNASYMYLETNADSGVYIDAQTRVAGYLCSSSNIQGNALLFSTSICGSGTKLGTGGANTSYTSDGLWGGSATPNYISNTGGGLLRLGYQDNGSGLYGIAYGFDVTYQDGLNRCIDYDAIIMRNAGQGTRPFRVTSYGNIYGLSKNFRIKHPIPSMNDTHYLVHTSIEGPQADLIYRGKTQLVNGKAEVNIDLASRMTDGTFELLCQDVQSYTTNESGWSLTKSYIVGNILHIEAQDETANDTISWLVIGERNDDGIKNSAITDENGHVIVEELKPEEGL
jgi:hypothetical protein